MCCSSGWAASPAQAPAFFFSICLTTQDELTEGYKQVIAQLDGPKGYIRQISASLAKIHGVDASTFDKELIL